MDRGPSDALIALWFETARAAEPSALGGLIRVDYGIVHARDAEGRTALHILAGLPAGGAEAAKVLVAAGVPVDGTDVSARTALWYAVTAPNREMALFLLEVGAMTDGCLHAAIDAGDPEIVRELIECGADLAETVDDETPVERAQRRGFTHAAELIAEELQRRS